MSKSNFVVGHVDLRSYYPDETEQEAFKRSCFDVDCMMDWIEL